MSLQIVSHYRIECDAPECTEVLDGLEDWDEFKTVRVWEALVDGVADTWEHGRAYCCDHADMKQEY